MRLLRSLRPIQCIGAAVVFAVFGAAWQLHPPYVPSPFSLSPATIVENQQPLYTNNLASSAFDEFVHSSSVAALPNGELMLVWFAGSREGAADVHIHSARYDPKAREWGEEGMLATRESTRNGTHKYIRKLGNPIIALAPDNRLWVFYVSVSIGGWAGSAINAIVSDDFGRTWSAPRQLVTTPFANVSTLVRSAPVFHADGSIGLPVYHEFLGKFAEYLYLDADARVVDKFRISRGKHSLQPTVVPLDEHRAVALLRFAGEKPGRVLLSRTEDAGRSWTRPLPTEPWNPNSSLAAVADSNSRLLVALNDLPDGRFRLSLYGTDIGGKAWRPIAELDESPDAEGDPYSLSDYRQLIGAKFVGTSGSRRLPLLDDFLSRLDKRVCRSHGCEFEYEYPYFIRSGDGLYHVVYSWNNTFIKHVSFNDAWLRQQQ